MRVLSDGDVASVLDLTELLDVTADGLRAQGRGDVERPERPHFPVGRGLPDADGTPAENPLGTGLVMAAYVHGANYYATKIVGVHEENAERGLPTVNASITLTAADTGLPAATMAGSRITNARTGCIGGVSVRALTTEEPVTIGVIGAGQQARWQVRAMAAAVDVEAVRVYSPSDSREACAEDIREFGIDATAVGSPTAAVSAVDVVVTATTASEPVFDGDDVSPGTIVVAVGAYSAGMRELDGRILDRAASIFADVPSEAAETGDFPRHEASDLTPLAEALAGNGGRRNPEDIVVVVSIGTAVLDAVAAEHLLERAREGSVGTDFEL